MNSYSECESIYASSGIGPGRRGFAVRHWKLEIKNRKIHSKLSNEVIVLKN